VKKVQKKMLRGVDATPPPAALRASFAPAPEPSLRESEISGSPQETALLIIDAQNYNCTRAGALWNAPNSTTRSAAEDLRSFFSKLQGRGGRSDSPGVIRNWVALAAAARSAGARVIFTGGRRSCFGDERGRG
jgi:hypothetical protein